MLVAYYDMMSGNKDKYYTIDMNVFESLEEVKNMLEDEVKDSKNIFKVEVRKFGKNYKGHNFEDGKLIFTVTH